MQWSTRFYAAYLPCMIPLVLSLPLAGIAEQVQFLPPGSSPTVGRSSGHNLAVLKIRGGYCEENCAQFGSAAVSDRGLLDSVRDRDSDFSVLQEYRASAWKRFDQMHEADLHNLYLSRKQMQELALQEETPKIPDLYEISYAAAVGVNVSDIRSRELQAGNIDGVCLRACDQALLQEEDEMYETAKKQDAQEAQGKGGHTGSPLATAKERRVARIKALLRCKAAAMTSEALRQQDMDGVSIPVLEIGTDKQREALRKLRNLWSPSTPPADECVLRGAVASIQSSTVAGESDVPNTSAALESQPHVNVGSATSPGEQNGPGPFMPMQHPYLVVRSPNCNTLLYEREQGDLEEGLSIEGLCRATQSADLNASCEHVERAHEHVQWQGPGGAGSESSKATAGARASCTKKWKVMNMTLQNELLEAAEVGDYDGLALALERGANIDTGDDTPYSVSALHLASRGNHLGCMQLLLQAGQPVNATDHSLATPLHYACDRGCFEATQLLLYAGANVTALDCFGRSPLHRAAVEAPRRVAQLLIDAGGEVQGRDLLLDSPLHVAAIWGNEGVARLLVAMGARGDDFNRFGHCPVVLADTWERITVAHVLREHLRRIGQDLHDLLRGQGNGGTHKEGGRTSAPRDAVPGSSPSGGSLRPCLSRKRASAGGARRSLTEIDSRVLKELHATQALGEMQCFSAAGAPVPISLKEMRQMEDCEPGCRRHESAGAVEEVQHRGQRHGICGAVAAAGTNAGAAHSGGADERVGKISAEGEKNGGTVVYDDGAMVHHADGSSAAMGNTSAPQEGGKGRGATDDEEEMSDPYGIRYRGFWRCGGLSGLPLEEDWGYTPAGKKRTNGIEAAERYFNVLQQDDLGSEDDDANDTPAA